MHSEVAVIPPASKPLPFFLYEVLYFYYIVAI